MDFITPNTLYLCLDQGGHASRAIVFNHEGETVATAYCDVTTSHPGENFVELDAEEVLQSIQSSLQQISLQLGDDLRQISAAGLATQRSNVMCWDKVTGRALSPIISWQDRRNSELLNRMNDHYEHIHRLTGLFPSPHYGATKLRWLLDNLPQVQQALQDQRLMFGPMSSFLCYHLLQEQPLKTDPVNASRTQLWNLKQKNWDPELLQLFNIPRSALPECVPSQHLYGHLQLDQLNIPMTIVTGDQSAAMYAYGQLQPDTAYINAGTGAFVSRPSGPVTLYSRRLLTSVILQNQTQSFYVLEGTVNGAGSALEWLAEQSAGLDLVANLPIWLGEVKEPPLFFNGISGLGAPFWVPDFHSEFSRDATTAEKAVAIIESIAFLLQSCLDEMHKLSSPPEQIQLTGGLSSLDGLCQAIADLSGLPVYRPAECEATARGLAYLLAECPHHWPEQQAGEWFDPRNNSALQQRFTVWLEGMLQRMRQRPLSATA